jgi:DMSO/TMAO reductase YedYZ molybdopterin-dependent catalytic subunit
MDTPSFTLAVDGEVDHPVVLRREDIAGLPLVERTVCPDCYGGLQRDSHLVKGLLLVDLLELARVRDCATSAIFYSADGYWETASLLELLEQDAFLACQTNGGQVHPLDSLPRLAIPGKYGYKWVKWVHLVRLVAGEPGGLEHPAPPSAGAQGDALGQTAVASAGISLGSPSPCNLYVWARKRLRRPEV